jgi:hypothetical protein
MHGKVGENVPQENNDDVEDQTKRLTELFEQFGCIKNEHTSYLHCKYVL